MLLKFHIRVFFLNFVCFNLFIRADIYLHNPRGSNNRLDEQRRDRDNDNRLFDSQNNERGGYNVGNLYYFTESKLQIEWTNQHSCNSPNSNCQIILQYMCDDLLRDGSSTRTIPEVNSQCDNNDCNTDFRFGMNENNQYYQECKRRRRNKGLFVADQRLGETAINTRQNPNGQRYAYECSEERDYYPYWHPTKWIDIAVLTNDAKKCEFYKINSENVKSRWFCSYPKSYLGLIPNSKEECEKITIENQNATWKESSAHNLAPPVCQETEFTRDNHLGNTIGNNPPVFNWTLPSLPNSKCVLRIRYNISTNDYNLENELNINENLAKKMSLSAKDASGRGYTFKNNPSVKLFSDLNLTFNLAINTAQYGRVFQDRSHVFEIRKRTPELDNKKIFNLNVRGKRGNIVQVYPGVEYDFVPNKLELSKNDFIHIQWTGSNTNPPNNAGQGVAGSDRSNILLLDQKLNSDKKLNGLNPLDFYGQYGLNYPIHLRNSSFLGLDIDDLSRLAFLQPTQLGGSMDELNDAGTYFDLGPRKITTSGVYHYVCSRNNNFSNRDQKGEIIVSENTFIEDSIGWNGGKIQDENFEIEVKQGAFDQLTSIRADTKTKDQILNELTKLSSPSIQKLKDLDSSSLISDFLALKLPIEKTAIPLQIKIKKKRSAGPLSTTSVFRFNSDFSLLTKMTSSSVDSENIVFETTEGGVYIAKIEKNYSVLIGTLVGTGFILILVGIAGIYFYRNPKFLERMRYNACNIKRSMSDQI